MDNHEVTYQIYQTVGAPKRIRTSDLLIGNQIHLAQPKKIR